MAHTVIVILLWAALLVTPCLAARTVDLDAEDAPRLGWTRLGSY